MNTSNLTDENRYLFHQGTYFRAYEMLGAHFVQENGISGVRFAVWAPHAKSVSVVGDFNFWDTRQHPMQRLPDGEIWSCFIPHLPNKTIYKYAIEPQWGTPHILKSDPFGFLMEKMPKTASRVYDLSGYPWKDQRWQAAKKKAPSYERPMLIYEVHFGSWRRAPSGNYLSFREMADTLIPYVKKMNYTHIEFLPLAEHPFDGSWGYQITGFFSVTSRYGDPKDFMYFVDKAHQNNLGVILDWVPGHFCKNDEGLRMFDGVNLFESDNLQRAENKGWGTTNFDYGRTEVQSFLISNALFWLEEFHVDGLRIDAVANMLYLNYDRQEGEWQPNKFGGTGNLEAIEFLKNLNRAIFANCPDALMIAEESTDWKNISRPIEMGGLGFNYKWNMGWMNDTLAYIKLDPWFRQFNQDKLTFSLMYAFNENFVLPLSHDEVVHGKYSLINKMPGDYWQKFAGLRLFFAYWLAHPGKKLLFMGGEFGQFIEWKYNDSLDWHLIEQYDPHKKMLACSRALNEFYVKHRAFWEVDFSWAGFHWIDCSDKNHSVLAFMRMTKKFNPKRKNKQFVLVILNFTPEVRQNYRVGVPFAGVYQEIFNTDAEKFGGSNVLNEGDFVAEKIPWHHYPQSIVITLPPLAGIYLVIT